MLFDLGWSEILLIGTVALVFIGPKDLPKAMRVAGYWVRKARTLSREFQSSIDQMIREAELDEMRQDLKKAAEFDLQKEFNDTIDPTGSLTESLKPPELPDFSASSPAPLPAAETSAASMASVAGSLAAAEFRTSLVEESAVHPGAPAPVATEPGAAAAVAEPTPPSEPEAHGSTPPRP